MHEHGGMPMQPDSSAAGGHAGMEMAPTVSGAEIAAVGLLSLLALAAGVLLAALFGDFAMSSRSMQSMNQTAQGGMSGIGEMPGMGEQGGLPTPAGTPVQAGAADTGTMPRMAATPGPGEMSGMGGMDMRPVDVQNAPTAPADARGNQPLQPTVGADGVKEFGLAAGIVKWNILPNVTVGAYAYNGQVPGPEIRLTQGDKVRVRFTNNLPEATSVHWHGLILDNGMDGAAGVTQPAVEPGKTFSYAFTAEQAGTYFYHTHASPDRQQTLGLYGALIVEPKAWSSGPKPFDKEYTVELGEWKVDEQGRTLPAMNQPGLFPNFFTINGKSYPATETVWLKVGERLRVRFIGSGQFIHPMHIHGGPFEIAETDGNPVPPAARLTKDTVLVGPGERYDVDWVARRPGTWLLHCHINDHITNNGAEERGGGGLTMLLDVSAT